MNWLINIIGKWSGINAIWEKVDGYKTKISGVALLLSGIAALLLQVVALPHDLAAILAFIKALPTDSAWLTMLSGLGVLGLGHKAEKAAAVPPAVEQPK